MWIDVIRPYGIGTANVNGDRLLSLCAIYGLTITHTQIALCVSDILTCRHPRSDHAHLLDYALVRQLGLRELRMTCAVYDTDHKLVWTKLHIYFRKALHCTPSVNRRKYNVLSQETVKKRVKLENALVIHLVDVKHGLSERPVGPQSRTGDCCC